MNSIHPLIKEILRNRGLSEEEMIEFFSDKPSLTYDPFLLKNMEAGVDLILSSIQEDKKICIYGDYDVDGVTSISLLIQILSHLTSNLIYYIPSRFDEGYGLNKEAIDSIKNCGAQLIVTVDCGSVSYEEVEYGKSLGLQIIVTDHHNISDQPANCILINPKQSECSYPFKHLSGCGVAFKLAQAIQRKSNLPKKVLTQVLDLVALATIGDIVPLIGENRTLTKFGLARINRNERAGLKTLMEEIGLVSDKIKSDDVAYIIVPHLNAAGRMLDAKIGVELLTSDDKNQIDSMTSILIENNKERRKVQDETFKRCKDIVNQHHSKDLFLLINARNAHEGIAGIVAGKIKDEYRKPAILVTYSGGEQYLKGTGRSIPGVNLFELLKKYEKAFIKFGGHSGACGFLMEAVKLEELRQNLNKDMGSLLSQNPDLFNPILEVEGILKDEDLGIKLAQDVGRMAPFGYQNEKPVFQMNSIIPSSICYMGDAKQHVRFIGASQGGVKVSCILFQHAQRYKKILEEGNALNLAGYLDINSWNGNSKIQFVLKEITC